MTVREMAYDYRELLVSLDVGRVYRYRLVQHPTTQRYAVLTLSTSLDNVYSLTESGHISTWDSNKLTVFSCSGKLLETMGRLGSDSDSDFGAFTLQVKELLT